MPGWHPCSCLKLYSTEGEVGGKREEKLRVDSFAGIVLLLNYLLLCVTAVVLYCLFWGKEAWFNLICNGEGCVRGLLES